MTYLKIKEFLADPENQNLINNNKWEEVYEKLNKEYSSRYGDYAVGEFTEFFYAADIDPLKYVDKIPTKFLYGSEIKSFNIPKNIKEIGRYAFYECREFTTITVPDGVTDIGYSAFCGCNHLKTVDLSKTLISINDYAFNRCNSLTNISLPENLKYIGNRAFGNCTNLTNIIIPNSVINIEEDAFKGCKNLIIYCEATQQPSGWNDEWNSDNIPVIWDCKNNIIDANGYVYNIVNGLNYAFKGDEALIVGYSANIPKNITIPSNIVYNGDNYIVTGIGNRAFEGCEAININIPETIITIGNNAFKNCTSLRSINIPENVADIGISAFENCYDLLHIEIPKKIKAIKTDCFSDCVSLQNITIPPNVISIGRRAFFKCTNFTNISIPPQVTVLNDDLFYYCFRLENVSIPSSIITIGNGAFNQCTKLKTINYSGTIEQWKNIKILPNNLRLYKCTIKCTNGNLIYNRPGKNWVEINN